MTGAAEPAEPSSSDLEQLVGEDGVARNDSPRRAGGRPAGVNVMTQQAIVGMVVLSGMLTGAWAQEPGAVITLQQIQPAPLPAPPPPLPTIDFKFGMLAVEPFDEGDPVENAPYSAEIVNEVTQDLLDGNRIERRTTGAVARDGRGRVRREHQLAAIGPVVPERDARMVTISDPAAGVHYSLDPVRKVAISSRPPQVRAHVEGAHGPMLFSRRAGPEAALDVHVEPQPPNVQTEQLGTKEYEGVHAEGTRTIATIPAGAVGNVRPIEIVSERWYSPELRVVVYSRRADPRFGDTIYRLTNITRAEPDASLFEVPADYKLEHMKPPSFEPPADPMRAKRLP